MRPPNSRFCTAKQNEKTTCRMGENFANHVSDKGLTPQIYKELTQPNKNPMQNYNRHFLKENIDSCVLYPCKYL